MNIDQRIDELNRQIENAKMKIAYYPFLQECLDNVLICVKEEKR